MDLMTWAWLIMTAVLLIGEMLTAGFFLIVFAVGSFGSFLVAVFGGSLLWQWIVFIVFSAIAFAGSRKFAKRVYKGPTEFGVGAERYKGMKAYVIETIDASAATGRIRVDREEWLAESVDGNNIPEGSWTKIVKIDGTRMVVRAVSAPSESPSEPEGSGTTE